MGGHALLLHGCLTDLVQRTPHQTRPETYVAAVCSRGINGCCFVSALQKLFCAKKAACYDYPWPVGQGGRHSHLQGHHHTATQTHARTHTAWLGEHCVFYQLPNFKITINLENA